MQEKRLQRRKLEDLNLLDDFLFGTILEHPVWGEPFSRLLLETIFQRSFGKLKLVPQRTYHGRDTDLHGAVMDVYFEELPAEEGTGRASVYDIEPDQKKKDMQQISRRARFYHALIDADCLKSGEDYTALKNVAVLFIMPNDPFGAGRMMYTLRISCVEEPGLPYDDGAQTVFLYTRGTEGNPPEKLRALLRYIENSVEENAVNEELEQLHQIVEAVKGNREVRLDYMKHWEWEREVRQEALEAGHAEGHAKGLAEGRAEGRVEGRAEGRAEERLNTERERQRAEQAEKEAARERQRAEQAEAELEKLRAELQRRR